jgi:hypothetical protein
MKFIDFKDGEMYYPKDIWSVEHNNLKYIAHQVNKINRRYFIYDLINLTCIGLTSLYLYKVVESSCSNKKEQKRTINNEDIPDDMPIE